MGINWFNTLFVFEWNVFKRSEREEPLSNWPRNPVKYSACAVAWKIKIDNNCLRRNLLEFQEIWPKNSLETMRMIYHEKSEFWHREFLIYKKQFTASYENRLCENFIRTVLTEGISCQFVVGKQWRKSNGWNFFFK